MSVSFNSIFSTATVRRKSDRLALMSQLTVLLVLLPALFAQTVMAEVTASVDRQEITANESLQLTVTSPLKVSSTLDLFSLNSLSLPQPEVGNLEEDFEVLDRRQNYRVQIENNQNNSVITWEYTLMPKRSGDLTIPSIEYDGESTDPITIQVREVADDLPDQEKDVFLEAEVDQSSVYVQQQFIFKVRLYYSQDLIRGELQHPDVPGVLFKQIGKQKEYSRYVGAKRFSVIEREYAVFPQEAGTLEIPRLLFSGTLIERRIGRRIYSKEHSPAIKVSVKPPPPEFTGKHWLPAQGLTINDQWSDPSRELEAGDSITRTINIQALGLEGVQLPPMPNQDFPGLKVYPEPGSNTTEEHAAGVTGKRTETQAIVALKPGVYTLPAIEIPWWDVVNDVPRVARLAERTINVTGTPVSQSATDSSPDLQPAQNPVDQSDLQATADRPAGSATEPGNPLWTWLTVIFMLLWGATALGWYLHQKRFRSALAVGPSASAQATLKPDLRSLERLASQGDSRFVTSYQRWLQTCVEEETLHLSTCDKLTEQTRPLINSIQREQYSRSPTGADTRELCLQIMTLTKGILDEAVKAQTSLPPLYPVN